MRTLVAALALACWALIGLLTALAVLSFVAAPGIVWKPSDEPPVYTFFCGNGHVRLTNSPTALAFKPYANFSWERPHRPTTFGFRLGPFLRAAGFDYHSYDARSGRRYTSLVFPLWAPIALLLLPALVWTRQMMRRRRQRRRLRSGLCVQCGYDVRSSIERCPECGAALPPAPLQSSAA